jgi:hypothetical protein
LTIVKENCLSIVFSLSFRLLFSLSWCYDSGQEKERKTIRQFLTTLRKWILAMFEKLLIQMAGTTGAGSLAGFGVFAVYYCESLSSVLFCAVCAVVSLIGLAAVIAME